MQSGRYCDHKQPLRSSTGLLGGVLLGSRGADLLMELSYLLVHHIVVFGDIVELVEVDLRRSKVLRNHTQAICQQSHPCLRWWDPIRTAAEADP